MPSRFFFFVTPLTWNEEPEARLEQAWEAVIELEASRHSDAPWHPLFISHSAGWGRRGFNDRASTHQSAMRLKPVPPGESELQTEEKTPHGEVGFDIHILARITLVSAKRYEGFPDL
jgi:hypothetical protein